MSREYAAPRFAGRVLSLALGVLLILLGHWSSADRGRRDSEHGAAGPRWSAAEPAGRHARRPIPTGGEARAAEYEAAARAAGAEADARSEFAAKAAEAWMAAGDWGRARRCLTEGLEWAESTGQWARVELLLGHWLRRRAEYEGAVRVYDGLIHGIGTPAATRAEAEWWAARALEEDRQDLAAVRRYARLAEEALEPRARLRAFDRWARAYVRLGDLEAAAGVLHLCSISLAPDLAPRNEEAAVLRAAFEELVARDRLREAIAKRRAGGGG